MPLKNIGTVYRKELTDSLRDRRTLISTLLVPLLLFPLMSVGFIGLAQTLESKAKEEIPRVMLLGGADSPQVVGALRASKKIEVLPATPDWKDKIINKEIRATIAIPDGFEASLAQQDPKTIEIYKYEGELKSSFSADAVERDLKAYREKVIEARLDANHVPASVLQPFQIKQDNVAPPEKVGGAAFGGAVPSALAPGGARRGGFAVGRTTFWEPVVDWRAGKLTREAAVAEIARRYQDFVRIFERSKRGGGWIDAA